MKDLAEQELKILEAQHPTKFHHLKLQLQEFIHLLDQEDQQSSKHKQQASIIQTEGSSFHFFTWSSYIMNEPTN